MPLDAICLSGVVSEVRAALTGLRVEKVQQPARDQIVLSFRGSRRLLLCAGASQARIHLTGAARENPAAPPMFCMLLRKHLGGGRLSGLEQPALERVVILTIDVVDELGEPGQRRLVLECMGRHSNLILLDGQDRIIDCLRRVDMEMSEKRQVLPGLFYRLPPGQEKANPLEIDREGFRALLRQPGESREADALLLDSFFGMSPLVCREIAAGGELEDSFFRWQETVREGRFTPWLLTRDGAPFDFSYLPIRQYGGEMVLEERESFSALLDEFYEKREQAERVRQRGADLQRAASTARDRSRTVRGRTRAPPVRTASNNRRWTSNTSLMTGSERSGCARRRSCRASVHSRRR